jgi:MFS family permease
VVALGALRDVLSRRDFRFLFAVRLVGQFGDGLLQAALTTFVLFSPERQPDAIRVAAAFAILLLPYSVLGPFVGVLLDRWRRRTVLVRANWLKAACTVPVVVLVASGHDSALLAVLVLVVLGISRFELAGLSASLPHVVSGRDLTTANALTPTAGTTIGAVGALMGVGLRALLGGGDHGSAVLLIAAAICFALAGTVALAIAATRLGPDGEPSRESVRGVVVGLVSGVRELRIHPAAGRAISLVGVHRIAFGALTAGALLLVRLTFNTVSGSEQALAQFAVVTGSAAIGALAGALLTPWASRRWGAVTWSSFTLAQAGIVGIGLVVGSAQIVSFPLLLLGAASIGLAGQSVKVCSDTIVQREVPDDHLGRVFALYDMTVNVCLVAGICLVALLSPHSGQAPALYIAIGISLIAASWWYWRSGPRRVRTAVERGPHEH